MFAWLTFIFVPPLIGAGTLYVMQLGWSPRTKAAFELLGNLLILIFLLVALYQFGDMYNRVVFYEFLAGCGVSLIVQYVVRNWKRE